VKIFFAYNILEKYGNYLLIIENNRKGRIWDVGIRSQKVGDRVLNLGCGIDFTRGSLLFLSGI
jgi:hypothetical protein